MSWFVRYARSSIGAKHIMAVTGLLLFLFAVVHMVGHLQMFGGRGVRSGEVVERLYREIRALRIYEGATEVQKLIIARDLLAHSAADHVLPPAVAQ